MRTWQSCDYYVGDIELFHERTYFPHFPFKQVNVTQWFSIVLPRAQCEALAMKHGGKAQKCFYSPDDADDWFLCFNDNDKAISFCRTEDFDRFVIQDSLTKI